MNYDKNSLMALLKNDINYNDRIDKLSKEIYKDKEQMKSIASMYSKKYEKEISEGTIIKHKALTEGLASGKSIPEIEANMGFIPSRYTPILNWLHFLMKEYENIENEQKRQSQNEKYKQLLHEELEVSGMEKVPELFVILSGKNITYDNFKTLKKLKSLFIDNANSHESWEAYKVCLKLCNKWGIDFNDIPH